MSPNFYRPGSPIILVFWAQVPLQNSNRNPLERTLNKRGFQDFLDNISSYLGNATREAQVNHGMLIASHRYSINPSQVQWPGVTWCAVSLADLLHWYACTVWPTTIKCDPPAGRRVCKGWATPKPEGCGSSATISGLPPLTPTPFDIEWSN